MPKLHILTLVLETIEKGREIKRGKTGREVLTFFSWAERENWKGEKKLQKTLWAQYEYSFYFAYPTRGQKFLELLLGLS